MNLTEKEMQARKEYNEKIFDIPQIILDGELEGESVIIKLFAFEAETVTEGGLIIPRYKAATSEGGRPIAKLSDDRYQARGVIWKVGSEVKQDYTQGDIVHVPLRAAVSNSPYFFQVDRSVPVSDFDGTIRIPASTIEFIEKKKQ